MSPLNEAENSNQAFCTVVPAVVNLHMRFRELSSLDVGKITSSHSQCISALCIVYTLDCDVFEENTLQENAHAKTGHN